MRQRLRLLDAAHQHASVGGLCARQFFEPVERFEMAQRWRRGKLDLYRDETTTGLYDEINLQPVVGTPEKEIGNSA